MKGIFKRQSFRIGTLILIVFLLIYLPSLLYLVNSNGIKTDLLRLGTIEEIQNVDGVFIRKEEIINSPDTGSCVMDAAEGEKVPAFYRIASVVKNVPVSAYEELKKKEMEIAKAQEAQKENVSAFSGDINKLDNEIIDKVKDLAQQSIRGSLVDSNDTITKIDAIVYKKSDIFGDSSKSAAYINKLKNEKATIESKLSNNITEIRTKSAGLLSFAVDGYESILTPDSIRNATPKTLENITVKETNRDFNVIDAQKGKPVAKLVSGLESYFVTAVNESDSKLLNLDRKVKIRINDTGYSMDAEIVYSSDVIDGKRIIALRFDTGLNETVGLRRINADIVLSGSSGLKVPHSCLMNIDNKNKTAEIALVKGMSAAIVKVRIAGMNNDAVIIDDLDGQTAVLLYKTYILNPINIREGQIIN
ncbi:putative membrane fusion protein [Ruminiclostridium sufflavum DSM 19573]|uniref:Putative membrane fusion protein n=1 Tax=Ruminiclostridium sufflavum DSM 19573 TaxID=1121337 RepID=A0A318XPT3_9FIRM|nr:HlyD family efflux transporter periplasmic adaptor subunit [Ruminiclostridium sufflavum]PYG89894.1 putative membrane fusion protein [Ruminiclostridium sufflavum DSM 19573]